jgi:hypothetical protein
MKIHKVCICGKIIGTSIVRDGTDIEITSKGICPACGGSSRRGSITGKVTNVGKGKKGR